MLVTSQWRRVLWFLIQPSFFTPSHRSTLTRSIPAHKFTNLAMPKSTLALTCNIAFFWWSRKLNNVRFGVHASCSGGISRQLLRSSTRMIACRFGRTQPMPSVNCRTIYNSSRKYAHNGHSRSLTGSSCYIFLSTKLFERCRYTVKIHTLRLNWDNSLCKDFNFLVKRLTHVMSEAKYDRTGIKWSARLALATSLGPAVLNKHTSGFRELKLWWRN